MARTLTKTASQPAPFSQASIALYDQAQPGMLATTTTGKIGIITEKFLSQGGMPHVWLQEPGATPTPKPIDLITKVESKPIAVILFSGGGGVECGMVAAGIEPILAVEYDPDKPDVSGAIAASHEVNFPRCKVLRRTVSECAADNFPGFPIEPDILWASPVCANFSVAKNGKEQPSDIEAASAVIQAVRKLKPKHFFLENVPAYQKSESWKQIELILPTLGYRVASSIVDMSDYGVPQARIRFIARASVEGKPLPLPFKQPATGWYDAIADLIPNLPESQLLKGQKASVADFLQKNDPEPLLIDRAGGRGRYRAVPSTRPANTILRSHFTDGKNANRNKFTDIWLPDGTVKSASIECMARLQGFPDWYQFPEQVAIAGSILGYSVPPKFVELLLKPLTETFDNSKGCKKDSGLGISFGKTCVQTRHGTSLLVGKTVTRRIWKDSHAQKFINAFERSLRVQALDKDLRCGGQQIGWLTLTEKPYQEHLADMPSSDLAAEGFPELSRDEFIEQFFFGKADTLVWVVRFQFEPLDTHYKVQISNDLNGDSQIKSGEYTGLSIAEIRRDGGTQPREKLDLNHIATLSEAIEDGAELDPVIVFYDGSDYWLADGFHRCKASEESGLEDIPVVIHQGTRRDAILYSVGANAEHKAAKPRSRADKRRAVTMLLNDPDWSKWSNYQIAQACKVNEKTVRNIRVSLTADFRSEKSEQPKVRTYTTKHGTTATMQVDNIGKGKKDEMREDRASVPPIKGEESTAADDNGNGEMETDKTKPTIDPNDYAIAFMTNINHINPDLLKEARKRIDKRLAAIDKPST